MSHESHPIGPQGELRGLSFIRNKAKAFAPVLAAVALTGLINKICFDDSMATPKLAVEYAAGKGCEKPTHQELSAVTAVLEDTESVYASINSEAGYMDERGLERVTAKKYGLTLVDTSSYMNRIDKSESEAEATKVVDDFMAGFDIDFSVQDARDVKEIDGAIAEAILVGERSIVFSEDLPVVVPSEPYKDDQAATDDPEPSELDTFRGAAKDFVNNVGRLPVEVVALAKVSSIDVNDELRDGKAGYYWPVGPGEIQISEEAFLGGGAKNTATHELTHAIDVGLCQFWGSRRDAEFRALNPPGFRYGQDNVKKDDLLSFDEPYGMENIREDKATVGESLLTALFPESITQSPAVLAKGALLLARIEHRVPGAGKYIATLNSYYLGSMIDGENTADFNPGDGGSG